MLLVLGKARSSRASNLGCWGAESPEWFDILPKNSAQDLMGEWVHCCDEDANHQLSIAMAFWIIQIVSAEECSSLMQNMVQICCSTSCHFECDSHTVHKLTEWHLPPPLTSIVMSSLFTHVHSSSLSLAARLHQCCAKCSHYINNGWTFSGHTSYIIFIYINITHYNQMGFILVMQVQFNICKSINMIHRINKTKYKIIWSPQ